MDIVETEKFGVLPSEIWDYITSINMQPRYNFWAKMAAWKREEAVCLSLNVDPRFMKLTHQPIDKIKLFTQCYSDVNDLYGRAYNRYDLHDPVRPESYLAWAKKHDVNFPAELERLLPGKESSESSDLAIVKAAIANKPVGARERDTLLKIIIGMAIAGYKYKPDAPRNDAIADIQGDLDKLGIPVSDDTIRKWLNEARELLPQTPQKS